MRKTSTRRARLREGQADEPAAGAGSAGAAQSVGGGERRAQRESEGRAAGAAQRGNQPNSCDRLKTPRSGTRALTRSRVGVRAAAGGPFECVQRVCEGGVMAAGGGRWCASPARRVASQDQAKLGGRKVPLYHHQVQNEQWQREGLRGSGGRGARAGGVSAGGAGDGEAAAETQQQRAHRARSAPDPPGATGLATGQRSAPAHTPHAPAAGDDARWAPPSWIITALNVPVDRLADHPTNCSHCKPRRWGRPGRRRPPQVLGPAPPAAAAPPRTRLHLRPRHPAHGGVVGTGGVPQLGMAGRRRGVALGCAAWALLLCLAAPAACGDAGGSATQTRAGGGWAVAGSGARGAQRQLAAAAPPPQWTVNPRARRFPARVGVGGVGGSAVAAALHRQSPMRFGAPRPPLPHTDARWHTSPPTRPSAASAGSSGAGTLWR